MKRMLKRIRGTDDLADFCLDIGALVTLLLMGVAVLLFGRGEQKLAAIFGFVFALLIGLFRISITGVSGKKL